MCPPVWAHWRLLANTIKLVLPSAHPSPQPKRQINRSSHFCTAHSRVSLGTLAPPAKPNTIETVHTGASWQMRLNLCFTRSTPSPQPKRQIDRFSRFGTAHGRTSLYCTMSTLFSQNCPQSWGDLDPHLIHDCLGESMPTIQTASRWVQPFSHT